MLAYREQQDLLIDTASHLSRRDSGHGRHTLPSWGRIFSGRCIRSHLMCRKKSVNSGRREEYTSGGFVKNSYLEIFLHFSSIFVVEQYSNLNVVLWNFPKAGPCHHLICRIRKLLLASWCLLDSDLPGFLHCAIQLFSSNPLGQSLCPSHSWFWEMHSDEPGQRTEGVTQVDGGGRTGGSVVSGVTGSGKEKSKY